MKTISCATHWVRIYIAGTIEVAKQIMREDFMREGLCVTVEPTLYLYKGGEEQGYVVGLNNYPRFDMTAHELEARATDLATKLMAGTHQHSVMVQNPDRTVWMSIRDADTTPNTKD